MKTKTTHILLTSLLLSFYFISYSLILDHQKVKPITERHAGIWDLSPVLLSALAGEFKGLVADYLTLEVGAQLGTDIKRIGEGKYEKVEKEIYWKDIVKIFSASQTLDPAFGQTYIVAQGWLPWDAGMIKETNEILEKAALARPWDWQPTQLAGFNTYYFLNNPGKAGKIYLQAAKTPDAPQYLTILGTRLAQKGGETKTAIGMVLSMLSTMKENDPGYDNISNRLQALKGTLVIENAVEEYKKKNHTLPESTAELISNGLLNTLPPNPYKVPYCIDQDGKIYFDKPDCRSTTVQIPFLLQSQD